MEKTPEYHAYQSAKSRCTNIKHDNWADYGGRGIKFLFTSFEEFLAHIGVRPVGMTLDRKNNDGHYEIGNVRWTTRSEQCLNRRKHVAIQNYTDEELLAEVRRRSL